MTTYRPDYILIPRPLLEDEELQPKARELYGYIYWLSQLSQDRCFASNDKLAEMMGRGTTPGSVANSLKELEDGGYISRTFTDGRKVERTEIVPLIRYKNANQMVNKAHQIVNTTTSDDERKDTSDGEDIDKRVIDKSIEKVETDKSVLPIKDTTPLKRLARFYSALYREQFDVKPVVKIAGKDGGIFKSLLKSWNEYQIAALLIVHFNWNGPFDTDEREFERLKANAFPLGWLTGSVNKYVVYLNDQEDVDMKDADSVAKYVKEYVRGMGL